MRGKSEIRPRGFPARFGGSTGWRGGGRGLSWSVEGVSKGRRGSSGGRGRAGVPPDSRRATNRAVQDPNRLRSFGRTAGEVRRTSITSRGLRPEPSYKVFAADGT